MAAKYENSSHTENIKEKGTVCDEGKWKEVLKRFLWLFRETSFGREMVKAFLRD